MMLLLALLVATTALAARFGVDSRDSMDWRPYDEALRRRT